MSTIPSTTEVEAHTVYDSDGAKYAQVVLVPTGDQHWQVQHLGTAIGAVHYDVAGQEWSGTGNHTYPTVGGPVVVDPDLDYVLVDLVDQATAFRRSSFWVDVPQVLAPVTPSVLAQGGILYFDEVDPLVLCSVPGCSAPAARDYGACAEHAGGDEVSACPACGDSAPHTSCDADLWEDDVVDADLVDDDEAHERWLAQDAERREQQAFVEWLTEADDDRAEAARAQALALYEEHLDDLVSAAEQRDEDGLWASGC